MKTTPCKNCTERKLGCHGTCESYTEWKKVQDDICAKRFEMGKLWNYEFESRDRCK